jgi:hypothetical protein
LAPARAARRVWRNRRQWTHPASLALLTAVVGSVVWLLLAPTGSDLSAQQVHARFVAQHGLMPVDMLWFGGTEWYGYSLLVPPLAAVVGTAAVGIGATTVAAAEFGALVSGFHVRRAQLGAVLAAVTLVANLTVGRITFAAGIAVGLGCLLALTVRHWIRWPLAAVAAVVTCAASPLAGLFLGLIAMTMVLRGRRSEGIVIGSFVALMLLVDRWLGQSGQMPIDNIDVVRAALAAALIAVCSSSRSVRIAMALSAVGVALAWLLPTPVGSNSVRLLAIFGAPVMVATSRLSRKAVVTIAVVVFVVIPPMTPDHVIGIGDDQNSRAYFRPLIRELRTLQVTGRLEIPPLRQRWETYYVSQTIPLARGWMTQLDQLYNPLFFDGTLDARTYRRWLLDNAVQYVAVAEGAPARAGATEREIVREGLPYLKVIWSSRFWTLYRFPGSSPVVSRPAADIELSATSVGFRAPVSGPYEVRLRWSRWLTVSGRSACLRPDGSWLWVQVAQPGSYRISSAVDPGSAHRVCASTKLTPG